MKNTSRKKGVSRTVVKNFTISLLKSLKKAGILTRLRRSCVQLSPLRGSKNMAKYIQNLLFNEPHIHILRLDIH